MLVGAGALHATDEVIEVADTLGAGVAKALLGKAAVPDDLPFVTGSIGLLGTKPSWTLMSECDTLLMVGSSFPYSEWLPKPGQARGVQVDIDGRMLNIRYPMELGLVGDAKETLRELLPLLHKKEDRSWREQIESEVADWWRLMEERAMQDADPINPQRLFWELNHVLPADAIISADSGSSANWYARDLKLGRGHKASLSGTLATMGPGVPYAIAAKFAYPDRPALALVGDGAMQMNGMAELITAAKYFHRWTDPRLVVLVLNNRDLNQVTWEQRAMSGDPKNPSTQEIPDVHYADFAKLIGLDGVRIETPDEIEGAWDAAFSADRPFVIDAVVDPDVPPLPPHITVKEAKSLMKALRARRPRRPRPCHGVVQAEDPRVPAWAVVAVAARIDVAVERLDVARYTVPTDEPESDGTADWNSTTIVVVEAHGGGKVGARLLVCARRGGCADRRRAERRS